MNAATPKGNLMTNKSEFVETPGAVVDLGREARCGFSEVIYGESKTAEDILAIARALFERGFDVFATRVSEEKAQAVMPALAALSSDARYNSVARTLRVPQRKVQAEPKRRGKVAVVSAGTSDRPVAEEALETAKWTGAEVVFVEDVGVAGPQRLIAKLPLIEDADAIVVVAGMEGALPSVVGGWVAAPIVAVPTSVGYGAAFGGLAALLGMTNSCASNVTVVNIDAGFKAGYVAGLIAKRVADAVNAAVAESRAR